MKSFKAILGLSLLVPAVALNAGVAIGNITGGSSVYSSGFTTGWAFDTEQSVTVTALGFFAEGLNQVPGAASGVPVGLWTEDGTLLASGVVTATGLLDGFYYTPLPAGILLVGGKQYVIGARLGPDDWAVGLASSITTAPEVSFVGGRLVHESSLAFPYETAAALEVGFFGPNFQFEPVPEPATMLAGALLLLPFGVQVVRSFRTRRS